MQKICIWTNGLRLFDPTVSTVDEHFNNQHLHNIKSHHRLLIDNYVFSFICQAIRDPI